MTFANNDKQFQNTYGALNSKSSISAHGGGSFDNEMKKYGLTNDLKKLDSFNQFIE